MPFTEPDSFSEYVVYARSVAQFGFFSTSFFCFTLIFLTLFGVKRDFGSYKYLLISFTVFGIFFATFEMVLYPNVYNHNAGFIFYSTSRPFDLEKDTVTYCLAFYTGVYSCTISWLSVQFLYRYWAIFDAGKLKLFDGPKFLIWVAYSVIFGIEWAFGVFHFLHIDDYSKNYLKSNMLEKFKVDISEISGQALIAYDADGNFRWWNLCGTLNMTCVMLVQYSVITYCAYFMHQKMEEKLQMLSLSLRNLHKQFFKTLVLQIVTPTITLFSPVMFILYLPLLDLKVDLPTGIFLCAFTIYPAMDAAIVMYVVQDYRKASRKILKTYVDKLHSYLATAENNRTISRTKSTNVNIPMS